MLRLHPEHVQPLERVEHEQTKHGRPHCDGTQANDVPAKPAEGLGRPGRQDAVGLGFKIRICNKIILNKLFVKVTSQI